MNNYISVIKNLIQNAPKKEKNDFDPVKYFGSTHTYLGLSNVTKHQIAKSFHQMNPTISFERLITIIDALYTQESFEEKTMGPFILERYKSYPQQILPTHLNQWLETLEGWCEIDTLCQSTINADPILRNWKLWHDELRRFAIHPNINHRRASLVLLCKSVRTSDDPRLYDLAIENINTLASERNILITKAISWILRSLTINHKREVSLFIENHCSELPAIAVRETRRKIETGKK